MKTKHLFTIRMTGTYKVMYVPKRKYHNCIHIVKYLRYYSPHVMFRDNVLLNNPIQNCALKTAGGVMKKR